MRGFVVLTAAAVLLSMPVSAKGLGRSWVGEMRQIEENAETKYPMALTLTANGAKGTATYPTLNCRGKWTKVAQKNGYVVYTETVTNKNGATCVNGMVTVKIDQGKVVLGWFGAFDGAPIVSTAVLAPPAK
jgi:hypothetical protein